MKFLRMKRFKGRFFFSLVCYVFDAKGTCTMVSILLADCFSKIFCKTRVVMKTNKFLLTFERFSVCSCFFWVSFIVILFLLRETKTWLKFVSMLLMWLLV